MAVVTGALFGLKASGTIAKTLTFADWKGIQYARTRVTPKNPKSTEQVKTRGVFTFLQALYKRFPALATEPWMALSTGQAMTPINWFLKANISNIRSESDLTLLRPSIGANGGVVPDAITATAGAGQITVAVTAPVEPAGWTLDSAVAVAFKDQDPHDMLASSPVAGSDMTAPYSIVLTGLDAGDLYRVGAWLKWIKPDNSFAYSEAVLASATPT